MILHIGVFFYNHEDYINKIFLDIRTLLSIPNVSERVKISIFDDGSFDSTSMRILQEVNTLKAKINLNLSVENQGVKVRAMEFVASTIDDEIVLFIAGDDGINVKELIKAWECMDSDCNIDLLICNGWRIHGEEKRQIHPNQWPYSIINKSRLKFLAFLTCFYPRPLLVQATLFRANILKNIDAFKWSSRLDDWPLFLKLFDSPIKIKFCNDIYISNYIYNSKSTSAKQENILSLVEEVINENCLNKIWGPRSLIVFRRFIIAHQKYGVTAKFFFSLTEIRFWIGLMMEVYYKCRLMLKI